MTNNHNCSGCWRLQTFSGCLEFIALTAFSSLDCVCEWVWGGWKPWKQWPEIFPTLSPANRRIIFAVTSSFLGRHCDGTQLSAYWRPHKNDGCALWQNLSWIYWEYLPQMYASGRRFIWHISIWRHKGVQSLLTLAQKAPHWCSCSRLPQQSLHRGGSWMAVPWIYTGNSTIIHPWSFQVDSLLKVNCSG